MRAVRPDLADHGEHVRRPRRRRHLRHRHGVLLGRRQLAWNGSRPRAGRMESYVVGEGDDYEARFRQIDELKYALRSVYMFAPWIRQHLHRHRLAAPGLAGRAPAGDDRAQRGVLRRPVGAAHPQLAGRREPAAPHRGPVASTSSTPTTTCSSAGPCARDCSSRPAASPSSSRRDTASAWARTTPTRSGFENAARVNRRLLRDRFGRVTTRHLEHAAAPLRKQRDARDGAGVRRGVRPHRGQHLPGGEQHLGDQLAVPLLRAAHRPGGDADASAKAEYVDTTTGARRCAACPSCCRKRRDQDFFCLNDGSFPEVPRRGARARCTGFLERYFPLPAPWETGRG